MNLKSLIISLFLMFIFMCQTALAKSTPITIKFGINSTDSPTVVGQKFIPVVKHIEGEMAKLLKQPVKIEFKIFRNYEGPIKSITKGTSDFVRLGPASYIHAKRKNPNIKLIVMGNRKGKRTFNGLIIVPTESKIKTLAELKGKRFAFGDEISTIGRYLSQIELFKAGICAKDLAGYEYLGRHDNVYSAVALSKFDAGALKESTFNKRNKKSKKAKVLFSFPNVTKPWIAREGLDDRIYKALQTAFLTMKDKKALKKLKANGFFTTSHEMYKPIEEAMDRVDDFKNCPK